MPGDSLTGETSFPITFPNTVFTMLCTPYVSNTISTVTATGDDNIYSLSNSSFNYAHGHDLSGELYWFAIGI